MGGLADRGFIEEEGSGEEKLFLHGQVSSDVKPYEELNELAVKCFDYDPNLHVPLKRGEERKIYSGFGAAYSLKTIQELMLNILTWNIRSIISSKSRLRKLLNKCCPQW